jgi:hypothetical protein
LPLQSGTQHLPSRQALSSQAQSAQVAQVSPGSQAPLPQIAGSMHFPWTQIFPPAQVPQLILLPHPSSTVPHSESPLPQASGKQLLPPLPLPLPPVAASGFSPMPAFS